MMALDDIFINQLSKVQQLRATRTCPDCGTPVQFNQDNQGDVEVNCPHCGLCLGWSAGFFEEN